MVIRRFMECQTREVQTRTGWDTVARTLSCRIWGLNGWVGGKEAIGGLDRPHSPAARGRGKLFRDPRATQAAMTTVLGTFLTHPTQGFATPMARRWVL